jgi:hypothetical protein
VTLERRFFGGHDVLIADATEAWVGQVDFVGSERATEGWSPSVPSSTTWRWRGTLS